MQWHGPDIYDLIKPENFLRLTLRRIGIVIRASSNIYFGDISSFCQTFSYLSAYFREGLHFTLRDIK